MVSFSSWVTRMFLSRWRVDAIDVDVEGRLATTLRVTLCQLPKQNDLPDVLFRGTLQRFGLCFRRVPAYPDVGPFSLPFKFESGCVCVSQVPHVLGHHHCYCSLFCDVVRTNGARADGYVMPKILPDFDSCDKGARCPGALDKLERRTDDTEDVIRERYLL